MIVGKIKDAYGIYGWIKIISFTEKEKNIFQYQPWFIKTQDQIKNIKLDSWQCKNKKIIIKIQNINNRNDAIKIKNFQILIENSTLPKLKLGEYYWQQIIGCKIINANNIFVGIVETLFSAGSNDVLVIKNQMNTLEKNKKKHLIPFINKKIIKNVDIINKIITVDWNFNL